MSIMADRDSLQALHNMPNSILTLPTVAWRQTGLLKLVTAGRRSVQDGSALRSELHNT